MSLFARLKRMNHETIVITSHVKQRQLLRKLAAEKLVIPLSFLTPQQLIGKVFYEMTPEAIHAASIFLSVKPAIARSVLNYLPTIMPDEIYPSEILMRLQALKAHLTRGGYLLKYPYMETYFKNKRVLVDRVIIDDLLAIAIERVRAIAPVDIVEAAPPHETPIQYSLHASMDTEIAYAARTIRTLMDEKVALNSVHVVCFDPAYLPMLRAVFSMYAIPIHDKKSLSLMRFEPVANWFRALESAPEESLYAAMTRVLSEHRAADDAKMLKLRVKFIQALNPFVQSGESFKRLKASLQDALENTKVRMPATNGVSLHHSLPHIEASDPLFLLGASEGIFPALKTEVDILEAEDKRRIHRDDAYAENKRIKERTLSLIRRCSSIRISCSERGLSGPMHEARFLHDIARIRPLEKAVHPALGYGKYGAAYDAFTAKKCYDSYLVYGESDPRLEALYGTHAHQFKRFDNRFGPLSEATLESILRKPLSLSFTSVNAFHKCRFRYLMEHVLRVDPVETTLRLDIGVFVHAVLEKHIDKDALTETFLESELQAFLARENRTLTPRERFLFQQTIQRFAQVFSIIKSQHARSNYTLFHKEFRHTMTIEEPYPARFTGVIDKVMKRDGPEGMMHVLLVDYKTGQTSLNLTRAYYGIDAQLLYYTLLVEDAFGKDNARVTGVYEQSVLPRAPKIKHKTYEETMHDALRLDGYTLADMREAAHIDTELEHGSYIKSLRVLNDRFDARAKTLSDDGFDAFKRLLRKRITDAMIAIGKGQFTINPKKDASGKDISCEYCAFFDVCFKKHEDHAMLPRFENKDALLAAIVRGGDA